MGRPKKNSSGLLVEITVKFYENEANGDLSKMKFTKIAEYAQQLGYDIREQHFRRDRQVLKKLEDLEKASDECRNREAIAAYRNLDVNEIFAQSKSLEELKGRIAGLDGYWRDVYLQSVSLSRENQALKARPAFEKEMRGLEGKQAALSDALGKKDRENQLLRDEVSYLKGLLKKHLYPAVAEELLQEEGLMKKTMSEIVRAEPLAQLIEGKFPSAFDGNPHDKPEKAGRMEKSLQDLEGLVDET